MPQDYMVISMSDTDRIGQGGTIVRLTDVLFMVGTFGPFRVQVEKTGDWDAAMRTKIDTEVRRVKAITA